MQQEKDTMVQEGEQAPHLLAVEFATLSAFFGSTYKWIAAVKREADKIRATKYLKDNTAILINLSGEYLRVRSFNGEAYRAERWYSAFCCRRRHRFFETDRCSTLIREGERTNANIDLFPGASMRVHRYDIGTGKGTIYLMIERPEEAERLDRIREETSGSSSADKSSSADESMPNLRDRKKNRFFKMSTDGDVFHERTIDLQEIQGDKKVFVIRKHDLDMGSTLQVDPAPEAVLTAFQQNRANGFDSLVQTLTQHVQAEAMQQVLTFAVVD